MPNTRDPSEPGTILKERIRFFNAEFELYHGGQSPRMQLKMWMFGRSVTHSWKFNSKDTLRANLPIQMTDHVFDLFQRVIEQIQVCVENNIAVGRIYTILDRHNIMFLPLQ
jgi:hypothetical protein